MGVLFTPEIPVSVLRCGRVVLFPELMVLILLIQKQGWEHRGPTDRARPQELPVLRGVRQRHKPRRRELRMRGAEAAEQGTLVPVIPWAP